jgi:cell division protein FtsI/penicillin-binding protein 2
MRSLHHVVGAGLAVALLSAGLTLCLGSAGAAPRSEVRPPEPERPKLPTRDELLRGFDPQKRTLEGGKLSAPTGSEHRAMLTVDASLDGFVAGLLERYDVPYAGVVAIEPSTGRVLSYVSHSSAEPGAGDWVLDASAPAASVFKVVTGAALLDHGVTPETTTCYHGGYSVLRASELEDNAKLDTACVSLTRALGSSVNVVFGKLALRHLDPQKLSRYAGAFGFGEAIPFDVPTMPSVIEVPRDPVEFARTAAGFWHMRMSPLHGALIAATIGNQGRMMRPYMVERIVDARGRPVSRTEPTLHRNVIERRTAELLGRMMRTTITQGTARKTFFDSKGNPFLPGIDVAGKTGTLSKERPYRGYTWWVGFAPANNPKIALAALVVNSPKWRIKASFVAREALRHYLIEEPKKAARAQLATR